MKTEPWLHRYDVFAALFALIAIVAGAIVTDLPAPLLLRPQRPSTRLSNSGTPSL